MATFPKRAVLWHDEAIALVGSASAGTVLTTEAYNLYASQGAGSNGDSFMQSIFIAAGSYVFSVLGELMSDRAKLDWYLDGVVFSSGQDWYAAATTPNTIKTFSPLVIATDGYHVLKGVVNGKNASSSGFKLGLTKYWFAPVGGD